MQGRNTTKPQAQRPVGDKARHASPDNTHAPVSTRIAHSSGDWEGITTMSAVAPLVPEQFYPTASTGQNDCGEVALMRAILEDAIHCFQRRAFSHQRRDQRLAREAEEWFLTNDSDYVFSFVNICAVLVLEPDYIRRGLKLWLQQPQSMRPRKTRRPIANRPQLLRAA
jgi:hypothetical protein